MEPATVNAFLDQFLAVADSGFGLIRGDVTFVLNALIAVSIVLAGAQWALAGEAPLAPFFRKVLFIGFFAFLVNNWGALATAINQSGAMLGLRAGGGALSMADFHNPGRVAGIGMDLFGRTVAMSEGMNILTDFIPLATVFIAALFVMLGFFILALQVFVALIAFKLGALAAFVALPWGVFTGTSWVAERPLGWVAGSAIRLFILALIASVSLSFADTLPATLTLDEGGALSVLLFGLTVLALAWFGPMLASEVMQGQPHLSGSDAVRTAIGGAATGIGAAMTARYVAGGALSTVRSISRLGRGAGRSGRGGGYGGAGAAARPTTGVDYAGLRPRPAPVKPDRGSGEKPPEGKT